jgi:uncharacterized protein YndB with AHSA1/START domain
MAHERTVTETTVAGCDLLGDAGILIDRHAMVWIRRLEAPIEELWALVSTKDGLARWWLVPPKAFELRPGGLFDHHWRNVIVDFEEHRFIDFSPGDPSDPSRRPYADTVCMRFELSPVDDNTTMFTFLDTWEPDVTPGGDGPGRAQPGGPGTPWSGVAAGWHAMVNKLALTVNRTSPEYTIEELEGFYVGYLTDLYRWNAMVRRESSTEP